MRKRWTYIYRIVLVSVLVVPGILFHPSFNPVAPDIWNIISEQTYSGLLRFQQPNTDEPSKVAVVQIDDETIDELGWPLDRSYYTEFLNVLQEKGHPYLLSTLWFEPLATATKNPIPQADREAMDAKLSAAIADYGRYVGTNIKIDLDEGEPTDFQEASLLPRVLLTKGKVDGLPLLPLNFMDGDQFTQGQAAFGFTPQNGTGVVHCTQMLLAGPISETAGVALPSSVIWAAALASGSSIQYGTGYNWTNPTSVGGPVLRVDQRHCLSSPSVLSYDFLKKRQLKSYYSFKDIIKPDNTADFSGKVVILATTEGAAYITGPGIASKQREQLVYEHHLMARFLDDLLTGETILRPIDHIAIDNWLPPAFALTMLLMSLFFSIEILGAVALAAFVGCGFLGGYYLYNHVYLIPMHTLMAAAHTIAGLGLLYAAMRINSFMAQLKFSRQMRRRLARCNSIQEIAKVTSKELADLFPGAAAQFEYDRNYYVSHLDSETIADLSNSMNTVRAIGASSHHVGTVFSQFFSPKDGLRFRYTNRKFRTTLSVHDEDDELGQVTVDLSYPDSDRHTMNHLLTFLGEELSTHWSRVKMLIDQKVKEYKLVAEKSRGDIMSRFLSEAVLSKFSEDEDLEANLQDVLQAKAGRAALMQADIRGYSKFAAKMDPLEMVHLLQSYYHNVVDSAQQVAQVKLIGDCIFLFIERGFGSKKVSPCDLMLHISSILVRETLDRNVHRKNEELNFGIAIHYGDVVVGNLSSEFCIDYTVIGPNVNQAARMEELTKHKQVQEAVGLNGIIFSEQAYMALVKYKGIKAKPLDLAKLGVSVRDFPTVTNLHYITSAQAVEISQDDLLFQISKDEKFAS